MEEKGRGITRFTFTRERVSSLARVCWCLVSFQFFCQRFCFIMLSFRLFTSSNFRVFFLPPRCFFLPTLFFVHLVVVSSCRVGLCVQVPDDEADVAVLEEPEHLNFFRAEGVPWLNKFG